MSILNQLRVSIKGPNMGGVPADLKPVADPEGEYVLFKSADAVLAQKEQDVGRLNGIIITLEHDNKEQAAMIKALEAEIDDLNEHM